MATYWGILDGEVKAWGVRVPDLPGVNGGGASPEEAIADAISAAQEWVEYQRSKGFPIAAPRHLEAVLADAAQGDVAVLIPVAV